MILLVAIKILYCHYLDETNWTTRLSTTYLKQDIPAFEADLAKWACWLSVESSRTWKAFPMDLAEPPQEEYTWELPDLVDKTTRRAEVNTMEHFDEDEHLKLEKRVTEVSSYALAVFCVHADIAIQTVLLSVYYCNIPE